MHTSYELRCECHAKMNGPMPDGPVRKRSREASEAENGEEKADSVGAGWPRFGAPSSAVVEGAGEGAGAVAGTIPRIT